MVGWGWGWDIWLLLWVDCSSLVSDIGDISIITIGRVLDMLDTSIGKSNRVGSGNIAGTIGLFLSIEVGLGVVISNGVGEGVGRHLIRVGLSWGGVDSVGNNWGSVGNDWGGMDSVGNNWGSVDSVGNWVDSVVDWGMDGVSYNWGSMDSVSNWVDSVVDWGVDSMSHNWGSVDCVGNWGMGNHMGWSNMGGKVTSMSDNSSVADGGVVGNIRGWGGGSKAEEGGNDESLQDEKLDKHLHN